MIVNPMAHFAISPYSGMVARIIFQPDRYLKLPLFCGGHEEVFREFIAAIRKSFA